ARRRRRREILARGFGRRARPRRLGPGLEHVGLGRVALGLQRLHRPLRARGLVAELADLALERLALGGAELRIAGGRDLELGLELDDALARALELALVGRVVARLLILGLGRRDRLLGELVARDLGLRQRVLRDVARALGGELGVHRVLELDLELGVLALGLLAIAIGALELLGQPIAIRLDLAQRDL